MSDDRITWLLPVKNGMPYLPETLASIEAQTYKNWEILAWDNGSTDNTVEELKKWIPDKFSGRVITEEPLTLGGSLARMVEICETELCARIDADDINLPERLEKQLEFLSNHPDISVLGSWMYLIDEQAIQKKDLYTIPLEHDDIVHEMLTRNPIAHPSAIFRRSAILNVGNYRDRVIEDFDLWLRVSQQHQLANLDIPLVKYRIHGNSYTQQAIREERLNQAMNDCICENAPLTFGCSESDMRLLRERKHSFAFQPILQIAKHLKKTSKSKSILFSQSFINNTKNLISPKDILSRLLLSAYHPNKSVLYQEIKSIVKSSLRKTIGVNRVIDRFNWHRNKKKWEPRFNKWLRECEAQGSTIHPSITFTGVNNPFDYINIGQCIIEPELTLWLSPDQGAEVKFTMGNRSYIGRNTYIGVFKPISIGECVLIGSYCYIISANHNYETCSIPIIDQGYVGAPITIEDDVWIGTHVVVLPNVTIGKGAVIAAHSLVNKSIPPYEVWGGIPAKFLKKRT
ncbi:glycosyltransferase [Nodosilinea sp. FACHB-13]|uniref:glycosyltransferase n=1 Tax=Cyanophyceae TaxID=3028117 RepID=UPI001685DDA5|nr:glycosyltransferase [Nodosilinea sp. FACHB-13]MBD2107739.1 glycosyltransferase [Nodosilinea sp. FACHB-13]